MTRIVIVGEMFYSDLSVGGGPMPGGPGSPPRPDQGLPGGQPYPDQGLPGGQGGRPSHPIYHPGHPDHGLPAFPSQGLPGQQPGRPDQGLPPFPSQGLPPIPGLPDQGLPPHGEPIPPDQMPMPDPPPDLQDDIIVAVYKPEEGWTATSYQQDDGGDGGSQPTPTPHQVGQQQRSAGQRRR